jgi:hypothetical protein
MQKGIVFLAVLPFLAFQCKKNTRTNCLQAKIIRVTCASTVMQVLNNNSIGEDGWSDSIGSNGTTYDNVFSVSNKCKIASEHKVGDVVYITIDKPQPSDCVICMMYDAPPKVSYDVKTIGQLPCSGTDK